MDSKDEYAVTVTGETSTSSGETGMTGVNKPRWYSFIELGKVIRLLPRLS